MTQSRFLNQVNTPADLRALSREDLPKIAQELTQFVIDSVSQTGGHLSSNLGTVELTIALHYVFNTPMDRLIWDVGHQSYAHKILTGRRDQMHTLRKLGGISGFPRRSESMYDSFGTAHSSTSISAAMGMARAFQTKREKHVAVAVIGDGAMSAGMAFEALNNAGIYADLPLVVVLNDNDMSISPAVGALNRYLARLMSGSFYANTKKGIDSVLSLAPPLREFAKRFEEHAKGMVVPGTIFEEFGFNYIGPIDGHDLDSLVPTLQNVLKLAREGAGPQFLHVVTKKGHGYKLAEVDPVLYHGPGKFDPLTGILSTSAPIKKTFTQVFGDWLCDQAQVDKRLIGITPAMREGSGLVEFEKRFPDRYYDVGIAEQHAVTFAAGLACEGLKPVVAIYSTFLQRGYDQLIHDVAIQNLPVVFALDRAGIVGADGATHAGAFDIAFLRCIPNMVIMAPANELECRQLLSTAYSLDQPTTVRYPRGVGAGITPLKTLETLPIGKAKIEHVKQSIGGTKLVILCFGTLLYTALKVAHQIDATVVNMRFVKPLDEQLLRELGQTYDAFVTLEDGVIAGGAGSACLEFLSRSGLQKPFLQLGFPDQFIDHGDPNLLMAQCGLDERGIEASIVSAFPAVLRNTMNTSDQ